MAGSEFESRTNVLSGEWSFQLTSDYEWVGKQAFKEKEERIAGWPSTKSLSSLSIQRLNVRLPKLSGKDLQLGLEYRILDQRLARDRRMGWLSELMWSPMKQMRIGVGYNFTDFSDNEFSANDYSMEGWFFRLQGKY